MENLSTLLQLFTLTAILVFESSSEATTCTAGNFTLGQDANLTCHFPKDIYKGKICILYHPASGSQNTKDIMCPVEKLDKGARRWNGRYELWTGSKYNAVVTIKAVTKEDAGNYLCQFVPPGPMDATSCSLNVEAKHEATTPDSVRNPQPTTSPGNVSLTHASRDEDGKTYVKEIGIGAAAFLVVLVFILGAVIFLIHKRKTKDRGDNSHTPPGSRTGSRVGNANPVSPDNSGQTQPLIPNHRSDQNIKSSQDQEKEKTVEKAVNVAAIDSVSSMVEGIVGQIDDRIAASNHSVSGMDFSSGTFKSLRPGGTIIISPSVVINHSSGVANTGNQSQPHSSGVSSEALTLSNMTDSIKTELHMEDKTEPNNSLYAELKQDPKVKSETPCDDGSFTEDHEAQSKE